MNQADIVGLFIERCEDYKAQVLKVPVAEIGATIATVIQTAGLESVVLPSGLDQGWTKAILVDSTRVISDDPSLSNLELNEIDGVVTSSKLGIAETGTIVLDHGPDQGRRALSLVPDTHICVVGADQVVADVPDAIPLLRPSIDASQPLTWISGPSATSDIELERVEGVHGPRRLIIILGS